MIKKKPTNIKTIEIDLTGSQGNAFYLLGTASKFARQLGYTNAEYDALMTDMRSKDYEHLVNTFDKHFGHFVVLYR